METELKLLIAPADVAALRRLAWLKRLATAKPATRLLRNTYFDTPDLYLKRQGMELRVRRVGRVSEQTLKAGGQAVAAAGLHLGLFQRHEWESRVAGPLPDLAPLLALVGASAAWQQVLAAPGLAQGLAPVFHSEIRRTAWMLRLAQDALVELVLDQGELRQGDAREPVSEIELELKAGEPGVLFDLALQLLEKLPLRIGHLSKAARGYALRSPAAVVAVKAAPVALDTTMTLGQGFRVIAGNCLAQIQDNEAGVLRGSDPECIHQMRVGLRRLRSALRLFAPWIALPAHLQQDLGWLGRELGAARDADVLAHGTLVRLIDACPQEPVLPPLRQSALALAGQRRQQAALAVASTRHARLMLGLLGWLEASGWQASLDGPARAALGEPLPKRATELLLHRHEKLLKSGKRLAQGSTEQRHRVRIAAKKARYATEFFQSLHSAPRAKRHIKRLTGLLDALGWLNDAAVADRLLREIESRDPALAGGASFARGYLCAATKHDMPGLMSLWRKVRSINPR